MGDDGEQLLGRSEILEDAAKSVGKPAAVKNHGTSKKMAALPDDQRYGWHWNVFFS